MFLFVFVMYIAKSGTLWGAKIQYFFELHKKKQKNQENFINKILAYVKKKLYFCSRF